MSWELVVLILGILYAVISFIIICVFISVFTKNDETKLWNDETMEKDE